MSLLLQAVGTALVLVALTDVFLTVLKVQGGAGFLSSWLSRGIWSLFRTSAILLPASKDRVLSYAGPTLLVSIAVTWTLLLLLGFSLIVWPALGSGIRASSGTTPTDFAAALYYSAYSLTTLGTGDLVPQSGFYRLLMVFKAAVGFSVLTLMITYFMSVYTALLRRNTFALSLHHRGVSTGDPPELLAGLTASGSVSAAQQELSTIMQEVVNLYESHRFYPVLHYFRFPQVHYALARVMFLVMDVASLVGTALDKDAHRQLVMGSAARGLQGSGQRLLEEVAATFLRDAQPEQDQALDAEKIARWREHYSYARERLVREGLTVAATGTGEEAYVALRRQWQPFVEALAEQMAYTWGTVACVPKASAEEEQRPQRSS